MPTDQLERYLKSLVSNAAERERLRNAMFEEIVAAGKAAGFTFTKEDLKELGQERILFWPG